jgi:hypothetical protein
LIQSENPFEASVRYRAAFKLWTEIFMLKTALADVLVLGAIGPSLVSVEERFESKPDSALQHRTAWR